MSSWGEATEGEVVLTVEGSDESDPPAWQQPPARGPLLPELLDRIDDVSIRLDRLARDVQALVTSVEAIGELAPQGDPAPLEVDLDIDSFATGIAHALRKELVDLEVIGQPEPLVVAPELPPEILEIGARFDALHTDIGKHVADANKAITKRVDAVQTEIAARLDEVHEEVRQLKRRVGVRGQREVLSPESVERIVSAIGAFLTDTFEVVPDDEPAGAAPVDAAPEPEPPRPPAPPVERKGRTRRDPLRARPE